jgi:acetoin utilization protein AcuC
VLIFGLDIRSGRIAMRPVCVSCAGDAHHGDRLYCRFEDDGDVIIAHDHRKHRYLYPGISGAHVTGWGTAPGAEINLPLAPGADDSAFAQAWPQVIEHSARCEPHFLLLQCAADSLKDGPITHARLTAASHGRTARALSELAERLGHGCVLATGGGG